MQQQSIGIYGLWGAFRERDRCWAIAEPVQGPARPGVGYASVTYRAGREGRGEPYFRLRGVKRAGSSILLRIDRRTFQLTGGGIHAWASDPAADAEIVASMRTGLEMSIETRSASGALLRDVYRLRGAATAIDAAAIACARRG